jgi:putative two-component system response regulator
MTTCIYEEPMTIMAVDDTPGNLTLLREMFKDSGNRLLIFPNAKMALKAAENNPPSLFLLDINMPEMNGFELCKQIKANKEMEDIPVIFISALNDAIDKVKAFSVGGVDFVTKPFHFEEVRARVATHLRLRKLQIDMKLQNMNLAALVKEQVREISDSQLATIIALSKLAESRDDDTGGHIERTQAIYKALADILRIKHGDDITDNLIADISLASPLHDIGKVGIEDSILLKPAALTNEEFELMKQHTVIGATTLEIVHEKYPLNLFLKTGIAIARWHHEKWDGSGYPDKLKGEDIPLCARIMAVADVYDALRSKRPYKPPFTHEKSVGIILDGSGRHFDPDVVDAFKEVEQQFAELLY